MFECACILKLSSVLSNYTCYKYTKLYCFRMPRNYIFIKNYIFWHQTQGAKLWERISHCKFFDVHNCIRLYLIQCYFQCYFPSKKFLLFIRMRQIKNQRMRFSKVYNIITECFLNCINLFTNFRRMNKKCIS